MQLTSMHIFQSQAKLLILYLTKVFKGIKNKLDNNLTKFNVNYGPFRIYKFWMRHTMLICQQSGMGLTFELHHGTFRFASFSFQLRIFLRLAQISLSRTQLRRARYLWTALVIFACFFIHFARSQTL